MIALTVHPAGILLPVKAQPGARTSAVRGEQNGALKVAVTQVAEKGKANKAIHLVLAKSLGLKKSQVELLSGETASSKQYLIRDVAMDDLAARIRQLLATL